MNLEGMSILFYDGGCGLCNRSVKFILDHEIDSSGLKFASLNEKNTQELFEEKSWPEIEMNTIYVYHKGELFSKSKGAFILAKYLRKPYSWIAVFRILPTFITDLGYDFVAKRRHKMQFDTCTFDSSFESRKLFS